MSYLNDSRRLQAHTTRADTTFAKQAVGTSLVALSDTEITYTPSVYAKKVLFEVDGTIAWSPDGASSLMCVRLQYSTDGGTSWTTYTGTELFNGNKSASVDYNWHGYKWSCQVDAWTGSRMLRLAARAHTSNDEFTWGRQYRISGGEGTGSTPIITVTSLTA